MHVCRGSLVPRRGIHKSHCVGSCLSQPNRKSWRLQFILNPTFLLGLSACWWMKYTGSSLFTLSSQPTILFWRQVPDFYLKLWAVVSSSSTALLRLKKRGLIPSAKGAEAHISYLHGMPAGYRHQLPGGGWELQTQGGLGGRKATRDFVRKLGRHQQAKGASGPHPALGKVCALGTSSPREGLQ